MAKLIKRADPITGKVQSHDAKYWGRADANAKAKKAVTSAVNPLSGQTVKHTKGAWDKITKQYVAKYGPLDITAPMGPYDVASSINAATRQKYDPQYKTLADQRNQSTAQDKNITDWYGQYRAQLNDAAAKSQAANTQAQAFSTNFANSSSNLDATQRAKIASDNQASATARGATVDPNQALIGQQADQSRRQNVGQQGTLAAQQAANAQTYFGGRAATTSGQELQGHQAEGTRRQNISKAVQALQSSEGDYRTTLRQQIQASERQNQLARATFGLNVSKAQQDAADKAAGRAVSVGNNVRTNQTSSANNQRTNAQSNINSQRAANSRKTAQRRGAPGGMTPSQIRSWNDQFMKALNGLKADPPPATGIGTNQAQAVATIQRAYKVSYSAALRAYLAYARGAKPNANKPADSKG